MKLLQSILICVWFIVLSESNIEDSTEKCKITDPAIYYFKIRDPKNTDIPNQWFKSISYLNNTKDSFAKLIGVQFQKFLATVASGIPNYIEVPNISFQQVSSMTTNATNGKIIFLRETLAAPRNMTVFTDWTGDHLVIKFLLCLDGLRIKYHVKSTIPKFEGDVEWVVFNESAVMAKMRVTPEGKCPIKFEENEIETTFAFTRNSRGNREQLDHFTVLLKCYIHFFVEEAVYFALKQLWIVLKRTICFSVKHIYQSDTTSSENF